MEDSNLSVLCLMKQIKFLTQQILRLSEDLDLAHEKISILEKDFEMQESILRGKRKPYKMNILHSKAKSV